MVWIAAEVAEQEMTLFNVGGTLLCLNSVNLPCQIHRFDKKPTAFFFFFF